MRYRLSALCLCTAVALFLLDGCGGGSRLPLNSNRSGRAMFTMIWPQRGRLIPEVSNSIVVQINSGTTPVTSQLLVRPANGGPASVTFSPLPTGTLTATASAYPSTDGTGVAQAQASMPLVITAGQNTTFSMTMATTIDHIDITPATPTVQLARRIQLIATAKDGLNNVVLTASDKWQWSTANPNNAAVDNTGIVAGIGTGTVQIMATELESGLSGSTLLTVQPAAGLVSWWRGEFNAKDSISGNDGTIYNGVTYTPGVVGEAFAFDGVSGAIAVADVPSLEITKSLSIDARIYVKGLPPSDISPSYGMIVFRGDSRAGFDPYYLGLLPDGRLVFQIANEADVGTAIYATPPTGKWVHVTATLDDASGEMLLYLDGQIVAQQITGIRPLGDLDPTASPGIGIGNHAGFPNSNFNFAFNGDIDEVQIYNTAITPSL